jgi:hypothetical protein
LYSEQAMGWTTGARFPEGAGLLLLRYSVQIGSGAHPPSYPVGIGSYFPGVKGPGCEAYHSLLSSAEIKNTWSYSFTPQYVLTVGCLIKYRDNFVTDATLFSSNTHYTYSHLCLSNFVVPFQIRSLQFLVPSSQVMLLNFWHIYHF